MMDYIKSNEFLHDFAMPFCNKGWLRELLGYIVIIKQNDSLIVNIRFIIYCQIMTIDCVTVAHDAVANPAYAPFRTYISICLV